MDVMRQLRYTGTMAKTPAVQSSIPPAVQEAIRLGNDLMLAATNLRDLEPGAAGDAHKHRKMLRSRAHKLLSQAAAALAEKADEPVPV